MSKTSFALVATLSIVGPALAQGTMSESGCMDAFKRVDGNSDGVLTNTEIPKAREVPPELAKTGLVARREFMAACAKMAAQAGASSPAGTEPTTSPETPGKQQPQGRTGPLDTESGGAPAESPQGQAPPGMQSAPEGSSKSTVEPTVKDR